MDILTGSYLKVISNGITYRDILRNKEKEKDHEVNLTLWYKDSYSQYFGIFHPSLHSVITFTQLCSYAICTYANFKSNFSLNILLCVLSQITQSYVNLILKTE